MWCSSSGFVLLGTTQTMLGVGGPSRLHLVMLKGPCSADDQTRICLNPAPIFLTPECLPFKKWIIFSSMYIEQLFNDYLDCFCVIVIIKYATQTMCMQISLWDPTLISFRFLYSEVRFLDHFMVLLGGDGWGLGGIPSCVGGQSWWFLGFSGGSEEWTWTFHLQSIHSVSLAPWTIS